MNMRYVSILAFLLVLSSGCTKAAVEQPEPSVTPTDKASAPVEKRERYEEVRTRLISEGWEPIPAKCSPQNLCEENKEVSTDMATMVSCGAFKKGHQTTTVCAEPIPDAMLVTSIKVEPAN